MVVVVVVAVVVVLMVVVAVMIVTKVVSMPTWATAVSSVRGREGRAASLSLASPSWALARSRCAATRRAESTSRPREAGRAEAGPGVSSCRLGVTTSRQERELVPEDETSPRAKATQLATIWGRVSSS